MGQIAYWVSCLLVTRASNQMLGGDGMILEVFDPSFNEFISNPELRISSYDQKNKGMAGEVSSQFVDGICDVYTKRSWYYRLWLFTSLSVFFLLISSVLIKMPHDRINSVNRKMCLYGHLQCFFFPSCQNFAIGLRIQFPNHFSYKVLSLHLLATGWAKLNPSIFFHLMCVQLGLSS